MLARIESQSGRNAALFLDAHRRLQRVLKHACQAPRFFLRESPRDLGVAAVNGVLNYRSRLDDSIQHDRKAMMDVRGCYVAELFRSLAVEPQMNDPTVSFVRSTCVRNAIAG